MARGVRFAIPSFLSGGNDLQALTARLLTGTRRGGRFGARKVDVGIWAVEMRPLKNQAGELDLA